MLKSSATQIAYTQSPGTSPQEERGVLCAVLKFVLFDSQASKGGPHDLTHSSIDEIVKNGPQKTEMEKT